MALSTGTRIGPYEITAPLGAGGMGEVYRARDTVLGRDVALKVLPELFATDPERLARFKREAQVLAALNHPHIAAIYGFERTTPSAPGGGDAYALAMELVEGETLEERIQGAADSPPAGRRDSPRVGLSVEDALAIARQIADALEAAHEQGIVHRDLKPANIKVRPDGTVKVLDFGLAKPAAGEQGAPVELGLSPTMTSPAMTQIGVILGTAAYMSPEQAKGRAADKRSDVWAFGCVLFEMLTGRPVFDGEDVTDVIAAVVRGEPEWAALPADVPPLVRTMLQRCLEKDRKRRLADFSAVRFAISEPSLAASGVSTVHATPATPRPRWRRALPAIAAAVAAGALVAGTTWWLRPSAPTANATRFVLSLPGGQQFNQSGQPVLDLSSDGSLIAYVATQRLFLHRVSEFETKPITEPADRLIGGPVFSPEGKSIAYWTGTGPNDGSIMNVTIAGGTPTTVCPAGFPFGMSWSGDRLLFIQADRGIMSVAATGGEPQILIPVKQGVAWGPQLLPDGETLLFTLATGIRSLQGATPEDWDNANVVVQAPAWDKPRVLFRGMGARFLPSGHIVYARGGTLFARSFDVKRLTFGEEFPVVEGVNRPVFAAAAPGTVHYAVSDTGTLVYMPGPRAVSAQRRTLARSDGRGGLERLSVPPDVYSHPRISHDGTRVAVQINDGKNDQIAIGDLSGARSLQQLTVERNNRFPVWSSDDKRVTFQSDRDDDLGIWWQGVDVNSRAERLTTAEKGTAQVPESWSPKGGRTLLFQTRTKDSEYTLSALSLDTRKVVPVGGVKQSDIPPASTFSPDGRWFAYATRASAGTPSVFVQPFPPTGAPRRIERGFHPAWSVDGTRLYFRRIGNELIAVDILTTQSEFRTGSPKSLELPTGSGVGPNNERNYDTTKDDRFIASVPVGSEEGSTRPEVRVVLNWFEELKQRVASGPR